MKMKIMIALFSLVVLWGCATKDPNTGVYSAPSWINSASNSVAAAATTLAPVNPYAGITDYAYKGVFGLIGLVAGGLAAYKNRQAVVDSMAQSVVGANAHPAVLEQASNTPHFAAISDAINSQVLPGKNTVS